MHAAVLLLVPILIRRRRYALRRAYPFYRAPEPGRAFSISLHYGHARYSRDRLDDLRAVALFRAERQVFRERRWRRLRISAMHRYHAEVVGRPCQCALCAMGARPVE
jgi:hypothetical protein